VEHGCNVHGAACGALVMMCPGSARTDETTRQAVTALPSPHAAHWLDVTH
jgi:hypothetical protein